MSLLARKVAFTVALTCAVSTAVALAAAPDDDAASSTAPANSRALRLSSVEGQARVVQDGELIADPALANMPLFAGSQLTTGNDGRVEVQLEDGGLVRLSPNSTLTFTVVEKNGSSAHTEAVLNTGLAYFELQPSTAEHSLRVSYGPASFAATSFSVVRLTMDAPPGDLAVFSGNVHLDRGDALQLDIHGGESLSLDANNQTRYSLKESIDPDSWDTWNADRDQALNAENADRTAASNTYIDNGTPGISDLDANGNWYNVPGQGYIWSPFDAQAQGVGWDPYGYGHWVFYPGRGWVWVSGYSWGYAAFDCGLWNYYDNFGWGWAPGGGCNPWWFGGGGWVYNVGIAPRNYRPPHKPINPPIHRPVVGGTHALLASNVIPVDRRVAPANNLALYARPNQPVTIAGHTVEPLKPIAPRQSYGQTYTRTAVGSNVRPASPINGYFPAPSQAAPGSSAARPVALGSHSGTQPLGHSSSASSGTHSVSTGSSASSHASSGGGSSGGGGGGGHVSSGGGGGGTHK